MILISAGIKICSSVIHRKGQKISRAGKDVIFTNIEDFYRETDVKTPHIISINGKGIISKVIESNLTETEIYNSVLPGANHNEFYFQRIRLGNDQMEVSIIKRLVLDSYLDSFKKHEINVIDFFLGVSCLSLIKQQVFTNNTNNTNSANAGYYNLLLSENGFISINKVSEESNDNFFQFDNEKVDGTFLIPFANAVSFYANAINYSINSNSLNESKKHYVDKQKFDFMLKASLSIFLLLLLINFFVFQFYFDKNVKQKELFSVYQNRISEFENLKKQQQIRSSFYEATGFNDKQYISFYADRFAATVPESITLSSLDCYPATKNENDSLSFKKRFMEVKGTCKQSLQLNEWLTQIKTQPYVDNAELLDYKTNEISKIGEFQLAISLK